MEEHQLLDDDELLVSPVGITELDSKGSPAAAIATSSLLVGAEATGVNRDSFSVEGTRAESDGFDGNNIPAP